VECCLGLGSGGQKAEENGAGAKELTLRRWTKNSLFPEECQVKGVARTHQQQRGNHTSTVTATRAEGCSDTGSGTVGRAAAFLFFWMVCTVHRDLGKPSRVSQYCYAVVRCAHLPAPQACVLRTRRWADSSHSDDDSLRVSKRCLILIKALHGSINRRIQGSTAIIIAYVPV
jgi:hypothetical protein